MAEFQLPHDHGTSSQAASLHQEVMQVAHFAAAAEVFKQLSDPTRVRIFWLLSHQEACVINLAAMLEMSSPAVSHHLRSLTESGLLVSRRDGKEVYYKAAATEQVRLLHIMIEKTMEISCPEEHDGDIQSVPELPELDAATGGEGRYSAEQLDTIRRVHDLLTENLDRRYTIDELSRRFLINPSSLKEMFKAVYGKSLAAHIKEHRMELASKLLRETGLSIAEIAERVGYENQSKFSAEFKKSVGCLPTEYRKLF